MLKDVNVNVKIKLAALWASVMFLYAYADITHFVLQPGSLEDILKGEIGGIEISSTFLFGSAILMTTPAIMIFLSVLLRARIKVSFPSTNSLKLRHC
jgi:hypothetical protein